MTVMDLPERGAPGESRPLRWRRHGAPGERRAVLELPGGVTLAVEPLRAAAAPERRLWDLRTSSLANPCDDRGFRCMSRAALRIAIDSELYRLGWPA